jgi:nucleoside-diphosphate-sugar epimerase
MKNLLILGGSGFVSGAVARHAVQAGNRVWAVTRGTRPLPKGVTGIEVDRHDRREFQALVTAAGVHWDAVIDCIGFVEEDAHQDSAVLGRLADHVVFVSTDFVYAPGSRSFPQNEQASAYNSHGYGGNKRRCETVLLESDTVAATVFRPCHIYGPGSLLGCLPEHGRDPVLIEKLLSREPIRLVGGGYFLQQPIYIDDLARVLVAAAKNPATYGRVANVAGPDVVTSRRYYEIIAAAVDRTPTFVEIPVEEYREANPNKSNFLDHRVYDTSTLSALDLPLPKTSLVEGLERQVSEIKKRNRIRS